jgi:pimeloyl-ACP methyl ester carboxylesterase
MAKDALGLIDHLNWKKCHVVGISMGGMIALEFALLAPEKVLSLTLMATHAGGLIGRAPFIGVHHILRTLSASDENFQIQNALDMLYGAKTLADPDKRKVRYRKKKFECFRFFLNLAIL